MLRLFPEQTSIEVCDDVLTLIFKDLKPGFLHSVLCASRRFNRVAMLDVIYIDKLKKYFPELTIPPSNKLYSLFKFNYENKFFKDPAAKKLAICIIEYDVPGIIRFFNIDLLNKKDGYDLTILDFINKQQNQTLRDLIFRLALEQKTKEKSAFSFFTDLEDYISALFGVYTMDMQLYQLAAALNQIDFIQKYKPKIEALRNHSSFLIPAIHHNHVEAVSILIKKGIWNQFSTGWKQPGPLYSAAKNNSVVITRLLLQTFGPRLRSNEDFSQAINVAASSGFVELLEVLASHGAAHKDITQAYIIAYNAGHVEVLKVLEAHQDTLTLRYNEENHQQMLSALLNTAINNANSVEYLASRITPRRRPTA